MALARFDRGRGCPPRPAETSSRTWSGDGLRGLRRFARAAARFVSLYTFKYSFTADHYLYVAACGPFALAAAGLYSIRIRESRRLWVRVVLPGVVLAALAALTFSDARSYKDGETLWRDVLTKNPDSYLANYNLGVELDRQGRRADAEVFLRGALRAQPDDEDALTNLGLDRFEGGDHAEGEALLRRVLALAPQVPMAHYNIATMRQRKGASTKPRGSSRRRRVWIHRIRILCTTWG